MASVKIERFGGIMPRVHPSLLPDGMAAKAHNCRLKSGKLSPLRAPSKVDASAHTVYHENGLGRIADARSVWCWKHTQAGGAVRTDFLAFPGRVYFAHGNIADDEYDRLFVTGDTGVVFTTSGGVVKENCPAAYLFDRGSNGIIRHCICKEALDAPRCAVDGAVASDEADAGYAYFFFSWFDRFGYESPASEPSLSKNAAGQVSYADEPLRYGRNAVVRFQPIYVPPEAEGVRVYKTNTGDETDNIQLVREFSRGELANLESEFTIRIDDTQAAEAMPEIEAPSYDLIDMSFVPGNFYAGRSRSMPHTVLFSEVDNPTNWATAYRYDVRDNLVKLAVTSNTVFALTDGTPYALSGTAPESMTVAGLATPAACVSEKSVVVYRNAVYFASNAGYCVIYSDADAGTSCRNVTEQAFTKEQWQALAPETCLAAQHDGALFLFFAPVDAQTGVARHVALIIDLAEGAGEMVTTHDEIATCLCTDDTTDDMYFVRMEGA